MKTGDIAHFVMAEACKNEVLVLMEKDLNEVKRTMISKAFLNMKSMFAHEV